MRFQKAEPDEIDCRHNQKDRERNTHNGTREHSRGSVDERIRAT